jgi:hypothetical protein
MLTKEQQEAMRLLEEAIKEATNTGLFDKLAEEHETNANTINRFCDLIQGV